MNSDRAVTFTAHARERVRERCRVTEQGIIEQIVDADREHRYSRHMPKWLRRQYGPRRDPGMGSADERRYVRIDDDGRPAVAVVNAFTGRIVVITVIRKNEQAVARSTMQSMRDNHDRARPGGRRRHIARWGIDRDIDA